MCTLRINPAVLTNRIREVSDDIKLSCTLLHELCPILNMNFDLWRGKTNSCVVALADLNYLLYVCLEGRKQSLKLQKQKFAGEQKDTHLNLTAVYLLHCFVFRNLSQHTSISLSYHQHLGR